MFVRSLLIAAALIAGSSVAMAQSSTTGTPLPSGTATGGPGQPGSPSGAPQSGPGVPGGTGPGLQSAPSGLSPSTGPNVPPAPGLPK